MRPLCWHLVCWLAIGGCYQSGGDDEVVAAASAIPEAAEGARGVDYPAPNASAGRSTGIAACDEYLRKIDTCKAIPPEAQKALREHGDQMREAILKATTAEAKSSIEAACKTASEGLTMCDTNL
jgi:hypothetical protein